MCENGYKRPARIRDTSFVMEYVVDLPGFQRPINEFVIKELAIISLNYDVPPIVFLFGPPIPWSDLPAKYKSVNLWLERNYHHLPWSAGELSDNERVERDGKPLESTRNRLRNSQAESKLSANPCRVNVWEQSLRSVIPGESTTAAQLIASKKLLKKN